MCREERVSSYHGMDVPEWSIDPHLVISAFQNDVDPDKVHRYAAMLNYMCPWEVPPILGWPGIIDEDDVEDPDLYFMSGEKVGPEYLGRWVWYVSDGHHRTLAALEAGVVIFVDLDPSCVRQVEIEGRFSG